MEQNFQKTLAKSDGLPKDEENGLPYKASWLTQFRAIMWRSWISTLKEPLLVKVRLIQTTVRNKICIFAGVFRVSTKIYV